MNVHLKPVCCLNNTSFICGKEFMAGKSTGRTIAFYTFIHLQMMLSVGQSKNFDPKRPRKEQTFFYAAMFAESVIWGNFADRKSYEVTYIRYIINLRFSEGGVCTITLSLHPKGPTQPLLQEVNRVVHRRPAGAPAVFTRPEPELECNFPAPAGASK